MATDSAKVQQVQFTSTFPETSSVSEKVDPNCTCCTRRVSGPVHRLVYAMEGMRGRLWSSFEIDARTFLAAGGASALARHGFAFEAWEGGAVYLERVVKPAATPAELFLQAYEITGRREDCVPAWRIRGHWHAEHVNLAVADRGGGTAALLAAGAARGRVKGVGAVLRGVRERQPMAVAQIERVFA